MVLGLAASRKWSRARSGFRAPRERCSICQSPQVCGLVIRESVISSKLGEPLPSYWRSGKQIPADSLKRPSIAKRAMQRALMGRKSSSKVRESEKCRPKS
jgi:hypothetical protein